ncbi:MAG: ribonuclease HII [Candidatus Latescibacterota bacterium]
MTVGEVRQLVWELSDDDPLWSLLEEDPRLSVRRLAVRRRRRRQAVAADRERRERMLAFERRFWGRGLARVAGVDEAGRGCLAGPVVAAAVILTPRVDIPGLDDSKRLTPACRKEVLAQIRAQAQGIGVGQVEAAQIDTLDILQASLQAMRLALAALDPPPEQVLVDGRQRPGSPHPELPIVDGDALSLSVAAASVVAKVHRDRLMVEWDGRYPGYGFAENKGYGSPAHLDALRRQGPSPLHRRTFGPVARLLGGAQSDLFAARSDEIRRCASVEELQRLGQDIGAQAAGMSAPELAELRQVYHRQRSRLMGSGERGEALAARYLEERGYVLLERRWRGGGGEIDLVVRGRDELVFVEVKTGRAGSLGRPEERVDPEKRHRLVQAARHYLRTRAPASTACRFDVVSVVLGEGVPQVVHLEDAFRP